tara:strand:- start:541 stop:1254 length:714 start_codon:yes stop_codon:yes gene_type:complete
MKRILLIGNDTLHRRFLINALIDNDFAILGCIFETKNITPPFKTGSVFDYEEKCFLENEFSKHTRLDLERVDYWCFPNANCEESQKKIAELNPDLCIVSGAGLLNAKTIAAFPDGLINIHLGNAQEYRGLDTNLWAIYHNDYENVGVTIHLVDTELDTGDVIAFKKVKLKENIKIHQLRFFEMTLAFELIQTALNNYLTNNLSAKKQEKKGRYYSFMPSDLKRFVADKFNRMSYAEK